LEVYATKEFARFARREEIADGTLCDAAERAQMGLIDADLGGGVIKQRIARPGQGKRGGYRTLMAFRAGRRTIFVHGFAKNERENIDPDELGYWQKIAKAYLNASDAALVKLIERQELKQVNCRDEN
jgi:hypothetical protein